MRRCLLRLSPDALFDGAALPRTFVSLGGWCGPALILGKLGLRTEAYPFDFSRVTLDGLLHFIQHGFAEGFYPPGGPPYTPECVGPWVLFRGQHTAFAHFDLNSAEVQAHFTTKMRRFEDLLDRPRKPVTFFRTVTARHPQAELSRIAELEAALQARNAALDYRIVVMVHDQGLRATAAQLRGLSPRAALWALRYDGDGSQGLFDRTHDAYRTVVLHSLADASWPAPDSPREGADAGYDTTRQLYLAEPALRAADVPLADMTADRFPWRCHDNLALIDGVASVGGTCVGIGSTEMLRCADEPWRPPRCRFCGDATLHAAGRPVRTERPFTADEDQLILIHLYKILTGGDKVAAVEQLAHEMRRGTYEVICRIQFLTNSSTKIMEGLDPQPPSQGD